MVLRWKGLFFMIFAGRNYLEFAFSIGYDDWNEDFCVRLIVPFLLVSFGYEFDQQERFTNNQEVWKDADDQ